MSFFYLLLYQYQSYELDITITTVLPRRKLRLRRISLVSPVKCHQPWL